ncbi:putative gustatory receptor 28a isoform X2 [Bradysia coprophila]|uniref:putative gustatory receptor 28a isoform X2 n=1 Tax=Bradysia coprophila TaxID=38358 RepID=UPI00187DA670|nr:putative gustatory receptor 28a isoform X2 [Bradysia coprophila]
MILMDIIYSGYTHVIRIGRYLIQLTDMFQSVFLRVITKVGLFSIQISGLWPFSFDRKAKKFKFLWYYTIMPIVIIGYPFVVAVFWSHLISRDMSMKKMTNPVVVILSVGFLIFNSVNFVLLFVSQYCRFHEMKKFVLSTFEVVDHVNSELDSSEFKYGNILLKFAGKVAVFMSILCYSIIQSISRYMTFEDNYVVYLMSALPNIIMKFHPDLFYGGLLLINFYLTQINSKVSSVLATAKELSETNDLGEQKCYQKMINFCELSDKLDRLCVLHYNVIEISEIFFRLCSFQTTLWVAMGLIAFLVSLFQHYISITSAIRKDEISFDTYATDLITMCYAIAEIYITTSMSDQVMTESKRTGVLLNKPLMRLNMDVRFKRSVETFSGQILLKSLNITGMGLFLFDASLMYSLVSTASAYLVILIQFELKAT